MRTLHASMLRSVATTIRSAATTYGVSVDTSPGNIGAAFAAQAIMVNAQIRGTHNLTSASLVEGADLLFVFVSIPRGVMVLRQKVPTGFYVVRVRVDLASRKGRAEFRDKTQRVIFALPLVVESGDHHHSVSGSFSRCHVSADVGFRVRRKPIVLTVTLKWC